MTADDVELVNGIQRMSETIKIESSKTLQRETLEMFVNDQARCVPFSANRVGNFWVPELQITKSQINLNIELKRQNSQTNRSIK